MTDTASIGHNLPDWSAEETRRLMREYGGPDRMEGDVAKMLAEASQVPKPIQNEETANIYTKLIKRLRDLHNGIEAMRQSEKTPHWRRGQAVDSFFKRMKDKLEREKPTDNVGAVDVLLEQLNIYNARRLAEEQKRRAEADRIAQEGAERAARARAELARQQREAEQAAARARSASKIAERQAEVDRLAAEGAKAEMVEQEAIERAQITAADAAVKSADMIRERHEGGAVNTMKEKWHVEITDRMQLDFEQLKPFFKDDHVLAALRSWAQITQHRKQMKGALIEKRAGTVIL